MGQKETQNVRFEEEKKHQEANVGARAVLKEIRRSDLPWDKGRGTSGKSPPS